MISIPDGLESQAHATTRMYMSHHGLGPDLSFLD